MLELLLSQEGFAWVFEVGGRWNHKGEKKRVLEVQLNEPSFEMVGVAC